jgi:hypothetical protein
MAVENKKESLKEKVSVNSIRSRIKYSNVNMLKNVKIAKKNVNLKYVSKKLKDGDVKFKHSNVNTATKQMNVPIRTQTLLGNISSNTKDTLRGDSYNQPDSGIQAVLYVSDKIDTAADIVYSSKRVVHAVRDVKRFNDMVRIAKKKGSVDKQILIKKVSSSGIKSGLRTARNVNVQVSNRFQSEDTDLGIRSFAEAEKDVRKTYDVAVAVKRTSSGISNAIKTVNSRRARSNEYINKIYDEKTKRYNRYKQNIQRHKKITLEQGVKLGVENKTAVYHHNKIKTNKTVINKTLNYKGSTIPSKVSKNAVKKAVTFILPNKNITLLLFVVAAIFFLLMGYLSSGLVAVLSQNYFVVDNDIAQEYENKVELLDSDLEKEIRELSDDDSYDDVRIDYIGDLQGVHTNFQEIFAVAAVEFEQDLTYSTKEDSFIEEIYEELYEIKVSTEIYFVPGENDEEVEMIRKIITVYSYDMDIVMNKFQFDEEQKAWARRLVSGFNEQFPEFAQQYGELTQEEIMKLRKDAPYMSNSKQKKLYDTALSIVGKVKYFWGGKSPSGWNDDWGESTKVTAKGSDTTGTYRPFGLDCSGYVDWVYKTAEIGNMLSGGGTAYQFKQSYPIREDELQIGDLAFLQMPDSSGINHVGIYIGKDEEDNNLYAHSEWGTGVTVNGFKGFKYFRRVVNFEME